MLAADELTRRLNFWAKKNVVAAAANIEKPKFAVYLKSSKYATLTSIKAFCIFAKKYYYFKRLLCYEMFDFVNRPEWLNEGFLAASSSRPPQQERLTLQQLSLLVS